MANEDLKRASRETADRLTSIGVHLTGKETSQELIDIQDAVDRFEELVTARGGDLMVDEGSPGKPPQPDDPHFGLPMREPGERVATYLERLEAAIDVVRRHGSIDRA